MTAEAAKLDWEGEVLGVQPRIRLSRSFDQRSHGYLGYVLRLCGTMGGVAREFVVAIGKAAQAKHSFQAGDRLSGKGEPPEDARLETADLYKACAIRVIARATAVSGTGPPFHGLPLPLEVYRARGHRRLAAVTFAAKCTSCIFGCEMAVEMVIDQWNPAQRRYRRETFCYGPKSCPYYAAGPARQVPGRKGMSWEEEDWVDDDATAHRGPDE